MLAIVVAGTSRSEVDDLQTLKMPPTAKAIIGFMMMA